MRDTTLINKRNVYIFSGLILILTFWTISTVHGHGGKHADQFTRLQALQKATMMYNQLINNGKLDQDWETGLKNVTISNRKKDGEDEIVVSFERSEGDPRAVYIFFNAEGKYAGSNFTGE
jgi:hypothetical protein